MAYTCKCKLVSKVTVTVNPTAILLDAKGQNPQILGDRAISIRGGTLRNQWDTDVIWCKVDGVGFLLVVDGANAVIDVIDAVEPGSPTDEAPTA